MVNFEKEFFRDGKRLAITSESRLKAPVGNNNK